MKFNLQELLKLFRKFRTTVWFRVIYLVVLGVIVAELFPFIYSNQAAACLGLLLMPAAVFVVPYYFGERSVKNFAVNAVPVIIIAILLVTAFQTQATTSVTGFDLTSGYSPDNTNLPPLTLWNGTVRPATGTPPADFNFTVRLKTVPTNLTNVTVYLNLTVLVGLSGDPRSYAMTAYDATQNGTWYAVNRHLDPGIYEFAFWANDTTGNFTFTFGVLGPITGGFLDYYALWGQFFALNMIIPFSFYYVIVFMFWYTARMRRMRARMIDVDAKARAGRGEEEEEKPKPKPKPAPGGKAAKVTAFTCTNCGADVDETDEKCPKCGAVFED